jgi:hypothetical protein
MREEFKREGQGRDKDKSSQQFFQVNSKPCVLRAGTEPNTTARPS